jgi:hypothetical protein
MSVLQDEGTAMRLRVRLPAGLEPDLGWSGTAGPGPYRLALVWQGSDVTTDRALPSFPIEGAGPVRSVNLQSSPQVSRLELQISGPVQPSVRRVGDSWVLTLEPQVPGRAPPPASPMARAPTLVAASPAPRQPAAPSDRGRALRAGEASGQPEELLLDIIVNGERRAASERAASGERQAGVARAEQWPDGALLLAGDAWTEARLAVPAQGRTLSDGSAAFALQSVPGATYKVNRQNLSLEINAPATAFVGSTLGLQGALALPPPRPEPGVMLNYDVSVEHRATTGRLTSGATLEAVAFSPWGNVVASALVRDDGSARTVGRLDTFWRYDMPHRMETLPVMPAAGAGPYVMAAFGGAVTLACARALSQCRS